MYPTYTAIVDAASRLEGHATRTPLLRSDVLDERTGARIFLKAEALQRTGSFKFRGAYNAVSAQSMVARKCGIVAASSGNHAQGVAVSASLYDAKATILMPEDAPHSKKLRTKRAGAAVVEYDRATQDRDRLLAELAQETGALAIHPFEDPYVVAGQGTVGLEIVEQLQAVGEKPDRVVVCTGGGGVLAGVWMAIHHHYPACKFHSAEPEGYDDYARSCACNERMGGNISDPSIQDAILTPMPGRLSFGLLKGRLEPGLAVSDRDALEAVAFLFHELKLVTEPGGAAALATILSGRVNVKGEVVVVTVSGGNIDPALMVRALQL